MIILKHVHKNFDLPSGALTALDDINLSIPAGCIFGVIGKSGAGKSTLLRCVNLLEKPTQGQVIVDGNDLTTLSTSALRAARRKIGMIFQHFNLLSSRTVYENVALPLEISPNKISRKEQKEIVLPLLELVGLSDKCDAYPSQLSGGQKQRVAIARALVNKPNVLLCDEATSALDPETTQSILHLLKNIRDKFNLTILLITHEMSVIKTCCDRIAILDAGKILEENAVSQFFSSPETDIAKNFVNTSMHQTLPQFLRASIVDEARHDTHPLVRLQFLPHAATQPIIAQLINVFNLRVNILQGNLEFIQHHPMGTLVIALNGEQNQLQAGLNHLEQIGVNSEVLGHVPNDIISFT